MTNEVTTSGGGAGLGARSASQLIPNRKVGVGALAGAVTVVLMWVLNTYAVPGNPIPAEIASATTTVVTFVLSYLVPEA